ncbi:tumor necrosis factor receptor superfamily member 18 [Bufo bufo]|uniref:tumor necrosis factor receptor superfamily member 18 n=1 Tax=Bufo bufo TaxID=8384 RepID=UPI001ABDBAE0|nr:tumor necrosis factor receptor superfamily member 18 [Bufo bufo]
MRLTWKMGSLLTVWCVLLLEGTAIFAAEECANNNYKVNINGLSVCCPPCTQSENGQTCPDASQRENECRCSQGYGCDSRSCTRCEKLPICQRSQLKRFEKETTIYEYYCENCPKGTYFEVENGICKPGDKQIFTTESNRDGAYGPVSSTQKPESKFNTTGIFIESSLTNWTVLALYLAVAVFILVLVTVAIHLLIWKMKAAPLLKIAGDPFQPHLIIKRNAKEDIDSWSCQYPEEEHGEHGNSLAEKQNV